MEFGTVLFREDAEGIPNPNFEGAVEVEINAEVLDASSFAVNTYNTNSGSQLEFESVLVSYTTPGKFFFIVLKAKDDGKSKVYFTIVYKNPLTGTMYLLRIYHIMG